MKLAKVVLVTAICSASLSVTAFAGTWKTGANENANRWWYDNGNGTYAKDGWNWIDGNSDGIAECYYFDADGWMLVNTTTPDGYQVNENGAWIENNIIKTSDLGQKNSNANTSIMPNEGLYLYYKADIFDENSQTLACSGQVYDGTSDSLNQIQENDRYPYQLLADPKWELCVTDVTENSFMLRDAEDLPNGGIFTKDGNKWVNSFNRTYEDWSKQDNLIDIPVENRDPDEYYEIIDENTFIYHNTYSVIDTETGIPTGQLYTEIRTYKRAE